MSAFQKITYDVILKFKKFYFQEVQESGAAALGIYNVGGVFVVLISGLFLACIVAYFESLWDRRAQRRAALLVILEYMILTIYTFHILY